MGYFLLVALACCGTFTSCVDDNDVVCPDGNGGIGDVKDAELMLTINFDLGPSSKVGDPGVDHGENVADWDNIGVYLVYETGQVLNFLFTKEEFVESQKYNVFSGNARVFAVAFPDGQTPQPCTVSNQVYNMKTLDVSDLTSGQLDYMQNIFSGVSESGIDGKDFISIEKDKQTRVNVTCRRLVAKVDMQYDVQPGLVEGNFVNAKMSSIGFRGVPQAYVFPAYEQEEPSTLPAATTFLTLESQISERNGRVYSYMFPGKAYLDFSVMYEGLDGASETKEKEYTAEFKEDLKANSWYKTNFTVKGTKVSSNDPIELGK